MNEIEDIIKRINKFRDARDWRQFHNPKDVALSLVLEASEVLEHFQWRNEEELRGYLKANKDALSDELADVLYWVLLLSHDLGIDIQKAFSKKMKKNAQKYPVKKAKGTSVKYKKL
jgi:dCTP diphosphatase